MPLRCSVQLFQFPPIPQDQRFFSNGPRKKPFKSLNSFTSGFSSRSQESETFFIIWRRLKSIPSISCRKILNGPWASRITLKLIQTTRLFLRVPQPHRCLVRNKFRLNISEVIGHHSFHIYLRSTLFTV